MAKPRPRRKSVTKKPGPRGVSQRLLTVRRFLAKQENELGALRKRAKRGKLQISLAISSLKKGRKAIFRNCPFEDVGYWGS